MPKEVEQKLKRQAAKHKSWSKERKEKYVWGTMNKLGMLHKKVNDSLVYFTILDHFFHMRCDIDNITFAL